MLQIYFLYYNLGVTSLAECNLNKCIFQFMRGNDAFNNRNVNFHKTGMWRCDSDRSQLDKPFLFIGMNDKIGSWHILMSLWDCVFVKQLSNSPLACLESYSEGWQQYSLLIVENYWLIKRKSMFLFLSSPYFSKTLATCVYAFHTHLWSFLPLHKV